MLFAFQESRRVEDATATLLHLLHSHLDKADAEILSADFSFAFNTIKSPTLANVLFPEFLW